MSLKRKRSLSPPFDSTTSTEIYRSEPIDDRLSTFIAVFSPTVPAKTLQASDEFKTATHRVAGWRKPSNQKAIATSNSQPRQLYTTGFDDDGEKFGGKHVVQVLDAEKVEGAVVVARWYGGVLLGPVRFTHIEECTRQAVRAWKTAVAAEAEKKRRLETEEKDRMRLVGVLGERDQSIATLRALLLEKEKAGSDNDGSNTSGSQDGVSIKTTPIKSIDYHALPLERLKVLEKARDASIGFLLKKIDQAEERQQKTTITAKADPSQTRSASVAPRTSPSKPS
ncbi:MAG: hypothetical protein M1820_004093 [Bogoriella megaspora]|nr:MAG: hypothetical protein M1820_004093 [Bogoriella megaspora]